MLPAELFLYVSVSEDADADYVAAHSQPPGPVEQTNPCGRLPGICPAAAVAYAAMHRSRLTCSKSCRLAAPAVRNFTGADCIGTTSPLLNYTTRTAQK